MNEISIIRKGSYIDYLKSGIISGFFMGFLLFSISLISNSFLLSLYMGLSIWIAFIFFCGLGFFSEEYYKRKKEIENLQSIKYSFLHENNFQLHNDLFLEGVYQGYYIRITQIIERQIKKKDTKYDIIEAFYTFESNSNKGREEFLTGNYFIGYLYFSNHCVGYRPRDWKNPNFKENLNGLISILKRENLRPFSAADWVNSYGKALKELRDKEEESRTKHIKIWKLDIKHIKNKRLSNP
ncbi:hypothetical protein Barb4_00626 [Bacteroidales bacterium Barb4]|nr:hypothetical protein Barb4_00626 [Bacteroidales bacterium Barb4]